MRQNVSKVPLEQDEQMAFVRWCQLQKIIVHHSGNEIGGSTRALKARAIKMKKMGTSKGFPDLLIFIPVRGVTNRINTYQPAAIEMKRIKGSTTTPEQKEWLKILELAGIPCRVCKGCQEAIKFVEQLKTEMESVCLNV